MHCTKRQLLIGAASALVMPKILMANTQAHPLNIPLYHTHTGEKYNLKAEQQNTENNADLTKFMRDHRTGDTHAMDEKLLDFLQKLYAEFAITKPEMQIISAYRSPKTNAALAQKNKGVAKKSLHMQGKAIDIRIGSIKTSTVAEAAKKLKLGGVGVYSRSNFIHLDTGRVRSWGS